MTRSLNEIEALSKRAARGAGLSWGLAEDGAKAVRWLAAFQIAAANGFVDLLDQLDGVAHVAHAPSNLTGTWCAPGRALCPLLSGAALSDCAAHLRTQDITLNDVLFPVLLIPFAAWAAQQVQSPLRVSWMGVSCHTDGRNLWIDGAASDLYVAQTGRITCCVAPRPSPPPVPSQFRGTIQVQTWARLENYAQRTYAPATEASRLLGAGAGTNDND